MDILIRGLSPQAVKQLERLAKEKDFKSRNLYVCSLLEDFAFLEKNAALLDRMEKQIVTNTFFMQQTEETLQVVLKIMKELIQDDSDTSNSA